MKERAVTERPHLKQACALLLCFAAERTLQVKLDQRLCLQVKILREAGKLGKDGKPLSKGLGFVEFTEHEHALCALRQLNNNPHPFGNSPASACTLVLADVGNVDSITPTLRREGTTAHSGVCHREC